MCSMQRTKSKITRAEIASVLGDEPRASIVFFADSESFFGRAYVEVVNSLWFHVALLFHPAGAHYSGYYFECTSGLFHRDKPGGWIGPQYAAALNAWRAAEYNARLLAFRDLRLTPAEVATCLTKSLIAVGRIRYAELALLRLAIQERTGAKLPYLGRTPHWCTCSEAVTLMLPARLQALLGIDRRNPPDNVYPSGTRYPSLITLCDRIDADPPAA